MVNTVDIEKYGLLRERLCLDFVNTSDNHPSQAGDEFLKCYAALVEWAAYVGAVPQAHADSLIAGAEAHPDKAEAALKNAVAVRDTIYRVLSAAAAHQHPQPVDMQAFNHMLSKAMTHLRLSTVDVHFEWTYTQSDADLEAMLWPVLWSASELLTSHDLRFLRECASDDCSWLFMDTSKNHSRRWCSMTQCGNRAKARTHYHRARKNG